MKSMCVLVVLTFITVACVTAFEDEAMNDRFRVWFRFIDTNGDGVLSTDDVTGCYTRHSASVDPEDTTALQKIAAKCNIVYPSWFRRFILRGSATLDTDQFIAQFTDIKSETSESEFRKIISRTNGIGFLVADANNNGDIDSGEVPCVNQPTPRRDYADAYTSYLLDGPESSDDSCPF